MFQLYQKLKSKKASFSYLGVFNDNLTDQIIQLSEHYLENSNDLSKINRRVSFLIAECFQNVVRHGSSEEKNNQVLTEKNPEKKAADFYQINVLNNGVVMTSCNLIPNSIVKDLKEKIDSINSLGPDELKKLYKDVLSKTGFSSKGGAGLGLIEMARKSGTQLQFSIYPFDEEYSHFFLSLEISADKEKKAKGSGLDVVNELYNKMQEGNKLMVYIGEFSEDVVVPLTEMIQQNFNASEKNKSRDKKILVTLIEILQNISVHGIKVENAADGIFSISKQNENFEIEAGNIISEQNYITLSNSFSRIDKMEVEEITPLYRKWLDTPEVTSGLGLLEIMRNSGKKYSYDFKKLPDGNYFFDIKVVI
ncbi:MAG: hypothetical protein IAF38_10120 [Bacteroidia bacterium]|nr:hypothetical protein [Bacteroidia bacterium]